MKRQVYLLTIVAASIMLLSCGPKRNSFEIMNGINISHWLSQSGNRQPIEVTKAFFTRADVEYIASLGFDHIRIPIDQARMFDDNDEKIPEAFALLHDALRWCDEFNLRAIVDVHVLRSHSFTGSGNQPLYTDPKAQEQFYEFWRKISGELKNYSVDKVAYECLNEAVADDPEILNVILNRCIEVIRELEPKRTILMGSNENNNYGTVKYLRPPANDPNIMISFHYYVPMLITHYQASWTREAGDVVAPVHYPGQLITNADLENEQAKYQVDGRMVYNIDVIEQNLLEAIEFGKKHNLVMHCGEWGTYYKSPEEDALRWITDVANLFRKHGIAQTFWDYKSSDFGMIRTSGRNGAPSEGVPLTRKINAILGKN